MKRLLSIGLNYEGSGNDLPDCHLDADAITRRALAAGYKGSKYTGIFTADDFLGELSRLRHSAKKSDTTLISFSGHGSQNTGSRTEADYMEEYLCFWDGRYIEFFVDDDFRNLLNEIKGAVILFLDCCFSGGMERQAVRPNLGFTRRFIPFPQGGTVFRLKPDLSRAALALGNKLYFLSASAESEVSWSTGTGGLFTKSFCSGYDRTRDKKTIKALVDYSAGVCAGDQTPNYKIYGGNAAKRLF